MSSSKKVPAIEKAVHILQLYSSSSAIYMGVTEIANALNLNKGTVHSILNTLMDHDFIVKSQITGEYALGPAITTVANAYARHEEIIRCFDEMILKHRPTCPEAFSCIILKREKLNILAFNPAVNSCLGVNIPVGNIYPPAFSSAGKVLLARFEDSSIEKLYDLQYQEEYKNFIDSKEDFIKGIHQVRCQGYCFYDRELGEDICGISAPLKNEGGKTVAAISMFIPKMRLSPHLKETYIKTVLDISKDIATEF